MTSSRLLHQRLVSSNCASHLRAAAPREFNLTASLICRRSASASLAPKTSSNSLLRAPKPTQTRTSLPLSAALGDLLTDSVPRPISCYFYLQIFGNHRPDPHGMSGTSRRMGCSQVRGHRLGPLQGRPVTTSCFLAQSRRPRGCKYGLRCCCESARPAGAPTPSVSLPTSGRIHSRPRASYKRYLFATCHFGPRNSRLIVNGGQTAGFNMAREAPEDRRHSALGEATFSVPYEVASLNPAAKDFRIEDMVSG